MTAKRRTRGVEVYAKSVFKELKTQGYSRDQIVAFASEMLELLTEDVRGEGPAAAGTQPV